MNLTALAEYLRHRLSQTLPGSAAHEPLRAVPVGTLRPDFTHTLPPRPGSVLIVLYEHEGRIKFPLTKRHDYLGAHGGQISLPGGKAEPGEDAIQTALREGHEEIGVITSELHVVGRLSDFFVIPSNFMIVPVVAVAPSRPLFIPQEREVEKIIEGDLQLLLRDDAVQEEEILAAKKYPMRAPHFKIEGEIVWGATAMMLNELRVIVRGMYSIH